MVMLTTRTSHLQTLFGNTIIKYFCTCKSSKTSTFVLESGSGHPSEKGERVVVVQVYQKGKKGPSIDETPSVVTQHTGFYPHDIIMSPFGMML